MAENEKRCIGTRANDYWEEVSRREYPGRVKNPLELIRSAQRLLTEEKIRSVAKSAEAFSVNCGFFGSFNPVDSQPDIVHDCGSALSKQGDTCSLLTCKREGRYQCGRCKLRQYCSKIHQIDDWKSHRRSCKMIETQSHDNGTKAAVARHATGSELIGSVVAKIPALMMLPQVPAEGEVAVCVNCCKPVLCGGYLAKCSGCKWPLCQDGCEAELSLHSTEECGILAQLSNPDYWTMAGGYECLWMIRVITLRNTNPVLYDRLMKIPEDIVLDKKDVVPGRYFAIQTLRRLYGISERDFADKELEHVWYILRTKCLKGQCLALGSFRRVKILCEYRLVEHSCMPNAVHYTNENFDVILALHRAVEKDEPFSISYDSSSVFLPTPFRQRRLSSVFKLNCCCQRCEDSSELGTYFGGIPCHCETGCGTSNKPGYLLPVNSCDTSSPWKCSFCQTEEIPWDKINEWLSSIRGGLEELVLTQDSEYLCFFLEELVEQSILHESHYLIFEYNCEALKILSKKLERDTELRTVSELLKYSAAARCICYIFKCFLPASGAWSGPVVDLCSLIKLASLVDRFQNGDRDLKFAKQQLELYALKNVNGKLTSREAFSRGDWYLKELVQIVMCPLISHIEMSALDVRGSGEGSVDVLNSLELYTKCLRNHILLQ